MSSLKPSILRNVTIIFFLFQAIVAFSLFGLRVVEFNFITALLAEYNPSVLVSLLSASSAFSIIFLFSEVVTVVAIVVGAVSAVGFELMISKVYYYAYTSSMFTIASGIVQILTSGGVGGKIISPILADIHVRPVLQGEIFATAIVSVVVGFVSLALSTYLRSLEKRGMY